MNQNNYSRTYLFGFSLWKQWFIRLAPFFGDHIVFIHTFLGQKPLQKALHKKLDSNCAIYIWGKQSFPEVEEYARTHGIPLYRVEDGFVRSVGLGSDLTQPYSLVVDSRGIYFDPTCESDLEHILQYHRFSPDELARGERIRRFMVEKKLSKYNLYDNIRLDFPKTKQIVVVPGQVEDDASIRFGAKGMNNLELLRQSRLSRPDAYIVYKPHPDVLAGNRAGSVEEADALRYCDRIVTEVGIDSVLSHADEVHTMTSLVGFEALLRGIKVVTYGLPFYAGWGLTEDHQRCDRRSRAITIDELVAATYLLYPRYIHPDTFRRCEIEEVLEVLERKRVATNRSVWVKWRNWLSRKGQQAIRMMKGKR